MVIVNSTTNIQDSSDNASSDDNSPVVRDVGKSLVQVKLLE